MLGERNNKDAEPLANASQQAFALSAMMPVGRGPGGENLFAAMIGAHEFLDALRRALGDGLEKRLVIAQRIARFV